MKRDVYVYSAYDTPDIDPPVNDEPSMTCQSYRDECDINCIMARYNPDFGLPVGVDPMKVPTRKAFFADCGDPFDFHRAQQVIAKAHENFDGLPVEVRARFGNDPGKLLEFLDDPSNFDEAVRLGLAQARAVVDTGSDDGVSDGVGSVV